MSLFVSWSSPGQGAPRDKADARGYVEPDKSRKHSSYQCHVFCGLFKTVISPVGSLNSAVFRFHGFRLYYI